MVIQRPGGVGCKKLINPSNIEYYKNQKNALVNPDTSRVDKIPLEFWQIDSINNRVLPAGPVARIQTRAILMGEIPVIKAQQKIDALVISKKLIDVIFLLILISLIVYGFNHHEAIREYLK